MIRRHVRGLPDLVPALIRHIHGLRQRALRRQQVRLSLGQLRLRIRGVFLRTLGARRRDVFGGFELQRLRRRGLAIRRSRRHLL